jgi:hypothetical protein
MFKTRRKTRSCAVSLDGDAIESLLFGKQRNSGLRCDKALDGLVKLQQ